jgi:hypothetical protein
LEKIKKSKFKRKEAKENNRDIAPLSFFFEKFAANPHEY